MKSDSTLVKTIQFTVLILTLTNLTLVVMDKLEELKEKKKTKGA